MTEIWNLNTLCRCCHADGYFKSLSVSYQGKNDVEIYENMLRESLGVLISTPPLEASYTICDACIFKLRDAVEFKKQVLECELKFQRYCDNEQFTVSCDIKSEGECELTDSFNQDDDEQENDGQENDEQENDEQLALDVNKQKPQQSVLASVNDNTEKPSEIPKKILKNKKNTQKITKNTKQRRKRISPDYSLIIQVDTDTGTKFSCKKCGGLYKSQKQINQHISKTHPTLFKCEYCQKELKSVDSYNKHRKVHTEKKIQCSYCPKNFTSKQGLKDHLNCHTREKIYECDLCQKHFKFKQTLIRHLKVHAGTNKKILCHLCGWSFNDLSNLNAHTRTVHEKLRPFHCKICTKSYSNQRHLRDHLKLHNGTQKLFKCDICDHRVNCAKTMEIHRLKHDGKFLCRFCSEIFENSALRTEHLKLVHNKVVQWHPCPICGKILAGKYSLNRHVDDHKGIKRFPCAICGIKFSQKSKLDRHIFRKHDSKADIDIGKTKCDICKRSYKNIVLHMDKHNTRLCACLICGLTYSNNSALNRHKALKHYGKTFDCNVCEKKYLQKDKLNAHKWKVHKIKIQKSCEER